MSGGAFDYMQYRMEDIALAIDERMARNGRTDEWGDTYHIPAEVKARMQEAAHTIRQAAEMVQRVDWYISGDDGPESLLRRWHEEVRPYWNEVAK